MQYLDWLPHPGLQLLLVFFLSFIIGLERETKKLDDDHVSFGGVRTYPLIGLFGFALPSVSQGDLLVITLGLSLIALFLLLAFWHKLSTLGYSGITSYLAALMTYIIGVAVYKDLFWIAATLCVTSVLLLELKSWLELIAKRIDEGEILTFTKFLLLLAVILPLVPNQAFTDYQINPFKIWLVVVAVSSVSYGSYILQKLSKNENALLLTAVLGGIYSSTVTTVALARKSQIQDTPHLLSGFILMASGMMYLRVIALLALFNIELMQHLLIPFLALSIVALLGGFIWSRMGLQNAHISQQTHNTQNPLEIGSGLMFAVLFVVMLIATHLAVEFLGDNGVYTLGLVMGVADVDPFIMGLTQAVPALTPARVGGVAILLASSSNNLAKGFYAYSLGTRETGRRSLGLLCVLSVLGLIPALSLYLSPL
jgi:uncharacterized membrane protein (DUF4010 family)